MGLDVLDISLFQGRVIFALTALTHGLFATFVVGTTMIGAITATLGYVTQQAWYSRLAYRIAFILVFSTATVSFFGVMMVFFLNILWPRFWHAIFQTMFWPFLLEACLFLGEAVFAYAWYYLWDWSTSTRTRRFHLAFIWLAATCAVAAMFLIDITASYMLTPDPVDQAWKNIFNPTMLHLHAHRWFGNLAWAGLALAALWAFGTLRTQDHEQHTEYTRAAGLCFLIGFGALLLMPILGYHYLLSVRYAQPQAFQTLMLGERSWLFNLVGLLYGLLLFVGSVYIRDIVRTSTNSKAMGSGFLSVSPAIISLATLILAMPYYLQHLPLVPLITDQRINPMGKMQPYKYFALTTLVLFGFTNWLYFMWSGYGRGLKPSGETSPQRRRASSFLIVMAGLMILMYGSMGWVRETARAWNGYLVYGHIEISDERPTYEKGTGTHANPP